ncbi:MAG TPA: 3-phosphoshikimate 1-carboxyvinyltransferase [Chloroflexota bacterium]|nr:3-phosphoshikimate 1-carboxyvinyltransferase [Chloroflexota bacterium]
MAADAAPRRVRPAARLAGELTVPGDKSISHRALLLNALAAGTARVCGLGLGADVRSTERCLKALGVAIEPDGAEGRVVHGAGRDGLREPDDVLDAGNSGTTMRFLCGVLAGQPFLSVLTGDASLRRRPMARVLDPLRAMGAQAWGRADGTLAPLAIRGGGLRGLDYALPVASAQLKSALLLASLYADSPTHLREPAASRDHTERLLRAQGVALQTDGLDLWLTPPSQPPRAVDIDVPGDFSSAAFWLVAACVHPAARVTVRGVGVNPGRTGLLDVLRDMGARLTLANERDVGGEPVADVTAASSDLRGVAIGGDVIPRLLDEVPVLAVAMAVARGASRIDDAAELRVKESDRLHAVAAELTALGATVTERPDGLDFAGGARLRGASVASYDDHRLAMALAVAGLVASGETTIQGAESVVISYPAFWDHLAALAA